MILTCATLCQLSYSEACPSGFVDVDDLRFGVVNGDKEIVVVYRGSDNLMNWIRDLEAFPKHTRSGYLAHHGIVDAVNTVRDKVLAAISGVNKPIVVTGHSLGGGMAAITAQELNARAITFGAPRVWWDMSTPPVFRHTRVVCNDDPVPMIPRLFFQHDESTDVITLEDDGLPVDVEDHLIGHYINRLSAGNYK